MMFIGKSCPVFGIPDIKPISNMPEGRVEIKMNAGDFAVAYAKTSNSIRKFFIQDQGETWELMETQSKHIIKRK